MGVEKYACLTLPRFIQNVRKKFDTAAIFQIIILYRHLMDSSS